MSNKPVIVVTMGDPCGIGPEIVAKALASGEAHPLCRPVVIGNCWAMEQAVALIRAPLAVRKVASLEGAGEDPSTVDILDPGNLDIAEITVGQVSAACGRASAEWQAEADRLVKSGQAQGITMAPVNAEAMKAAGVYERLSAEQGYMFLFAGPLRIVHLTDHLPVKDLANEIKKDNILALLKRIQSTFGNWGVRNPKIGVAGFNPHASGEEDRMEIAPAVEEAQKLGIQAFGPLPPDTLFHRNIQGEFDLVVAMYHDQGHTAAKTFRFESAIGMILGSPYARAGVAHGTAFDIVGKGVANPAQMLASLKLSASLGAGKGFPEI